MKKFKRKCKNIVQLGIKQVTVARIDLTLNGFSSEDDEGSSSPAPHAAPSHQASPSTPTKLLGPSPRNGTPKKANPRGLHPTTSDVNIAHLLEALETKDIVFHLVSGFGIRAADSNGKSDPYCIVHLGSHMLSSRVVEKSLEPTWNETFLFHVADAQEAIKDGRPYIELQVFDRDLMSADDFLGQAELPLSRLDPVTGTNGLIELKLYGKTRGGKVKEEGTIIVAAWFMPKDNALQKGPRALSFVPQATRVMTPRVAHGSGNGGVLYEVPVTCCVVVTLVGLKTSLAGFLDGVDGGGQGSTHVRHHVLSKAQGMGKKALEAVHPPQRQPSEPMLSEPSGFFEDDILEGLGNFGEDLGIDLLVEDESSSLTGADGGNFIEEMSPRTSISEEVDAPKGKKWHKGVRFGRGTKDEDDEGTERAYKRPVLTPIMAGNDKEQYLYCKLLLGSQTRISPVIKERVNNTALWNRRFLFCVPVPMRDRTFRVEVYRTTSATKKGRVVAVGDMAFLDMLPTLVGLGPPKDAPLEPHTRQLEVTLSTLSTKAEVATRQLSLAACVIDHDVRRQLYGQPYVYKTPSADEEMESPERNVMQLMRSVQSMTPKFQQQRQAVSVTHWEMLKATGQTFRAVRYAKDLATRLQIIAEETKNSEGTETGDSASSANGNDSNIEGVVMDCAQKPLGTLTVGVNSLNATWSSTGQHYVFCVVNCGSYWARSPLQAATATTTSFNWHFQVPVHDPSTLLLMTFFAQSSKQESKTVTPVVIGKLRVRLNCLKWGSEITSNLPLLSERKKGAQCVGRCAMSFHLDFPSLQQALVDGYLGPNHTKQVYMAKLDDGASQKLIYAESRRIALRWLESSTPPISRPVALAVLDTHREVFDLSRLKVNFRRIRLAVAVLGKAGRYYSAIESWERPAYSVGHLALHVAFFHWPRAILPCLMAYVMYCCLQNRVGTGGSGAPLHMEHDPIVEDDDDVELEIATKNPYQVLKRKYSSLMRITLKIENILDDVATVMERLVSAFSWQDAVATAVFMGLVGALALAVLFLGLPTVLSLGLVYGLRHPAIRTPWPPPPAALFARLPARGDRIA